MPDEQSLQELAARIDMEEQAIADLREKLAEMETDLTGKRLPAPTSLSLNQPAGASIDTPPPQIPGVFSRSGHRQFPTRRQIFFLGLLVILIIGGAVGSIFGYQALRARSLPTGKITEFTIPSPHSSPFEITVGPDGNLWFTGIDMLSKIGRITPSGKITEFSIPPSGSSTGGITAGPDGNLWFIDGDRIDRITPNGKIASFPLAPGSYPWEITKGPDGNLWFTFYIYNGGSWIGRITPSGTITEFPLSTSGYPYGITKGPDGNLWFTIDGQGATLIGRITPSGKFTEFALPTSGNSASEITTGPDGNLWFTDPDGNKIGRITPGGTITEYSLPTPNGYPYGIAAGADGNLWFTEEMGNKIGRITPSGTITEFPLPKSNSNLDLSDHGSSPGGIISGPDGNLWFTETSGNKIGRITTGK